MHCTSPGISHFSFTNVLQNNHLCSNQHIDDDLYDGPRNENLNEWWTSKGHQADNRNWFCCSNEQQNGRNQPNLRPRPLSCRYSIVREEPKSQSDIVIS